MSATIKPSPMRLSPRQMVAYRLLRHSSFYLGAAIISTIVVAAVLAPLLTRYDPTSQLLSDRLIAPIWGPDGTWDHILGTDQVGRDMWSRLIYGSRLSLTIALFTVVISGTIGTTLGIVAGYWRGTVDLAVNFLITVRLALPVVLVALVIVALFGASVTVITLVIGFLLWDRFAIVVRNATRQLMDREFVTSARVIGSSDLRILVRELLPNLTGPLIVVASVELAQAVLLEAALSFLGLGVRSPDFTWGLMISEAKSQLLFRPYLVAIPSIALVALILAMNLMGDALRDALTPESRN